MFPASDGVTDLGKSTKEWKDLYIDGVINTDNISADAATVTGNAEVGGLLNVGLATTLTGTATLANLLTVSATSAFKGAVSVESTLRVTGDSDVSNLSASGTLDVAGEATVANISASGTLDVAGTTNLATASITGTVNVTGETTLDNVSANGTLNVSGNGSVGGTFNVEGDLKNSAGNLTIVATSYIVEVKGGGSTDGAIQLNCSSNSHGQTIKAQDHSAGVTNTMLLPRGANSVLVSNVATQTLTNKTLDSVVGVGLAGAVNIGGNASVGGTLAVTGDTDVSNLSASGTFDVGGNASVGGTLAVTGDTDVTNVSANGTLDVSGNASVGGTFNVTGSAGLSGNVNIGNATADVAIISSQVEFQNNLRERTNVSTTSATGVLNFDVLSHNVELRTNDVC